MTPQCSQPTSHACIIIYIKISMQPTTAVILRAAKSEKIFQDAIMAEQVPCFQLAFDFLNVENDDFEDSSGEVACNFNTN